MLRHESNTGHLDDLSHIASEYCLADPLTKSTAKPDQLVSSIATGKLEQVDVHPPFRSLLKNKAFLTTWIIETLHEPHNVIVSRKFVPAISYLTGYVNPLKLHLF
jgi:hypothetical protein